MLNILTSEYNFKAVWKGTEPAALGGILDIELDASEVIKFELGGGRPVISNEGDITRVVGEFLDYTDDGVLTLDLNPGILMVECEVPVPEVKNRSLVTIFVEYVEVWPTGAL